MSEQKLEHEIRRMMRSEWIDHKHRDFTAGVPDTSFHLRRKPLGGWIEYKYAHLPRKLDTKLYIKWKKEQKLWVRQWGHAGCPCYIILGIQSHIMLWWWKPALEYFNSTTTGQLLNNADHTWEPGTITAKSLSRQLWAVNNKYKEG